MADKLAFVEVPAQLGHVPVDYHVISLSPLTEVALEQAGRPYTRPEDYFDEMALENEGIANFAKVETLCSALDAIFADTVSDIARHKLQPARWHYFWLKIVYDAFFIRAYQLRRVLAAEAPKEVLYFQRSQPDLSREWISQSESLYAILLDRLLPAQEIAGKRLEPVSEYHPDQLTTPGRKRRFSLLRVRCSLNWRAKRALETFRRMRSRAIRGRVLCLDYQYSIPYIASELQQLAYDVWVWRDGLTVGQVGSFTKHTLKAAVQRPEKQIASIWSLVEADRTIRDLFCWEGHDPWPAVAPRLRRLVEQGLAEVLNHYAAAQDALTELQPDVVLMSVASFAWQKAICHAARQARIPSIVSRHGEAGSRHMPMLAHQDIESVDWVLCWGRFECDWSQRYGNPDLRTAVVGAPMIETTVNAAPSKSTVRRQLGFDRADRIALYVPSCICDNHWYIGHHSPNDNSYFRQQKRIVETLMTLFGWRVVIKEHPGVSESPLERWWDRFDRGKRPVVIRYPGFGQLIYLADVVVLDIPSTTLVQALHGSARIYVVDHPVFCWQPGVVEQFGIAGIVLCSNVVELAERMKADLAAGLLYHPHTYPETAREPFAMVCRQPGGAARQAAQAVAAITTSGVDKHVDWPLWSAAQ
ncbi:hypothetical protein MYX82_06610 [Acidobacteria bacterium AH-259-D05]|nr:hypothetical protein [Acidobacteria bacterium AH-259-D05]